MGSFLPIKWLASEVVFALLISVVTLGLALSEIGLERAIDIRDIAYLVTTLLAVWFIWSLMGKAQSLIELRVSERTSSLSELACFLQSSLESERLALSQELHDELGAILTMAKLDVARISAQLSPLSPGVAACLDDLVQTLNCGLALKTKIVEDLRPSTLSHLGLRSTLENYLADFSRKTNIEVDTRLDIPSLDAHLSLIAFRIVQESLTNIVRHAHASRVMVIVRSDSTDLQIVIQDDGVGFEPYYSKRSIHGIAGMSHRVTSVGGRFEISSRAGAGTTVRAFVPVNTEVIERRQPSPREPRLSSQSLTSSSIF